MREEERLFAADQDSAEPSSAAVDGVETFPPPAAAEERPPTRAEFEQLAAEVRRLAGQIAHGRS